MRKHACGFTLVEIAIVLVIIGLLLGGVIKGQELIVQAKIKNIANDFNGLTAAVYSYQDRYKRLPGDDPGATRWAIFPAATATQTNIGNNVIDGLYGSAANADESRLFWAGLRAAGFVTGDASTLTAATAPPMNAAGGVVGVQNGALGLAGPVICAGSLPSKIAQAIDVQLDDGNMLSGSLRGQLDATPPTAVGATALAANTPGYREDGGNLYVICRSL